MPPVGHPLTVLTHVELTQLMLRITDRDRLTAKLRDQAQAMLLDQWLLKRNKIRFGEVRYGLMDGTPVAPHSKGARA